MKTLEQKNKDNIRSKKWREANLERARTQGNLRSKKWYLENKKRAIAKSIKYAKDNPEKIKQYNKKWRDNNPEKHAQQNFDIRYKQFNFTYNDYLLTHKKQKGLCAICKKSQKHKRLATDHCHKKNFVRGLLCEKCNLLLGYANDNIQLLKSAIKYLKKYEQS